MSFAGQKRKRPHKHPYLSGNFAPIHQTWPLTPCSYAGTIPQELAGGQYVRNGGNPVSNDDLGRDAHWFDGDGMLSGVSFKRTAEPGKVQPEFVNQFILTDLYLTSVASKNLRTPILPSIATLVNPASTLICICFRIIRALFLVILSHLPGSTHAIKRISVANTALYYHNGRALATCESGPPMRISLPTLDTVGWFNGHQAEGEYSTPQPSAGFGGEGLLSFMREWTTGHPKVDPITNEMVLFHSTFLPPYIHYSVLPAGQEEITRTSKILNAPVPGVSGAKMMHDFGVSRNFTVIMDLPLELDPFNLAKNRPVVSYNSSNPSRFGVFPRMDPTKIRWFETSACCIFHTANSWDYFDRENNVIAVNLLACRLTSATLVFSAGNIAAPQPTRGTVEEVTSKRMPFLSSYDQDFAYISCDNEKHRVRCFDGAPSLEYLDTESTQLLHSSSPPLRDDIEEEQCRLYYFRFNLDNSDTNEITHQYALSAIPFEFPSLHPQREMQSARYIYGCSTSSASSFGAALGRAVKIDVVVKTDVKTLLARGAAKPPRSVTGCVDERSMEEILQSNDPDDPIQPFRMPEGWFAQEPRFVPRATQADYDDSNEDDGYLLFYAFDESQLDSEGECSTDAKSELWILDAKTMKDVVARIHLPQRVPYGLHGNWFDEAQIRGQRGFEEIRSVSV
ncbi:carotenoid oxygenase [Aulographum hederae CBS 113979]|uniref:Carotenoid oxygenase n=1 Tax=Aulographum hederae CBS 113979 TaxID=1176131 RepID=A0A6G1GSW2_9PEZI|nr:carotenoid oxygenase [Aulographum hederae CBS 113979]